MAERPAKGKLRLRWSAPKRRPLTSIRNLPRCRPLRPSSMRQITPCCRMRNLSKIEKLLSKVLKHPAGDRAPVQSEASTAQT
jgi:hypothetical protein